MRELLPPRDSSCLFGQAVIKKCSSHQCHPKPMLLPVCIMSERQEGKKEQVFFGSPIALFMKIQSESDLLPAKMCKL